ncbi:beta-xylosidase [Pseudarthrobacter defluvii]|nr:beta-xylosidase [Pseudarthrobacter defluvii]
MTSGAAENQVHASSAGNGQPDPAVGRPSVDELVQQMTLEEKLAQLVGVWVNASTDGDSVAPLQNEMAGDGRSWEDVIASGLGQITRMYGTVPLEPLEGARRLAAAQKQIMAASRFSIPAQVHEECLAGLAAWKATAFPVPLAWGATFNPTLVRRMAGLIGDQMRALGVHQGLAPVLDVVRDLRWGRVEETIGEDPYLVGTVAGAYVSGLEASGIVATLKHFVGYSASRAGRNHAPVSMGPRELADVMLPPFELALKHGGARSVMHAYTDTDGVPAAANRALLTSLLRDQWGFAGTVVADYFGVAFLDVTHGVAADSGEAAALALAAGVDVELPTVNCYGQPLLERVRSGAVSESLVDTALRRVLRQKQEAGLLSPGFDPAPPVLAAGTVDLDPAANRALAREIAAQSLVLLTNRKHDGGPGLPLPAAARASLGVVGPLAEDPFAMLGCYSFDAHVGASHPDVPMGISVPTVSAAAARRYGSVRSAATGTCEAITEEEIADACAIAASVETCVIVVGDNAGLFGRGTSGEGNDAADLQLPGDQHRMLDRVLAAAKDAGTCAVVVVLSGRPYALGDFAERGRSDRAGILPGRGGRGSTLGCVVGGGESVRKAAGLRSAHVRRPAGNLPAQPPCGSHRCQRPGPLAAFQLWPWPVLHVVRLLRPRGEPVGHVHVGLCHRGLHRHQHWCSRRRRSGAAVPGGPGRRGGAPRPRADWLRTGGTRCRSLGSGGVHGARGPDLIYGPGPEAGCHAGAGETACGHLQHCRRPHPRGHAAW